MNEILYIWRGSLCSDFKLAFNTRHEVADDVSSPDRLEVKATEKSETYAEELSAEKHGLLVLKNSHTALKS